jgi:hypothetical protein
LPLLAAELAHLGYGVPNGFARLNVDLYHGDLVALGRGEILLPAG